MDYQEALKYVFASGDIPDGYFGDRAKVKFAFMNGVTIAIAECGCFRYQTPQAIDRDEALWLLQHHPTSNAKNIREV